MKTPTVGPHDPVLVFHANNQHQRWLGYWVECECGWIGIGMQTETDARAAHCAHVTAVTAREAVPQ